MAPFASDAMNIVRIETDGGDDLAELGTVSSASIEATEADLGSKED
jgi:hypothetical protein